MTLPDEEERTEEVSMRDSRTPCFRRRSNNAMNGRAKARATIHRVRWLTRDIPIIGAFGRVDSAEDSPVSSLSVTQNLRETTGPQLDPSAGLAWTPEGLAKEKHQGNQWSG
jgi:hypothetical protein